MLEGIRKRRNSAIILVAFAAIIIVFVFWGVGPNGGSGNDPGVVASVNGEPITSREYANLYKRQVDFYRETFKDQFTDEMIQKLDLKHKSIDILINRILALKEADAQGIEASEKEVQDAIRAMPAFSNNGSFDKDLYFKVLSSNRLNPAEFEKNVEADIVTAKIRATVLKDISVTDEEVRERYFKENKKVDLKYITVESAAMKGAVSVTDAEAKDYLQKNASDFMVPLKVKAFYAFARYPDFSGKAAVTEAEIKEYYEKNKQQFETPEAVKARHILIRPDTKEADKEKAKADAKNRMEDVLKKVRSGADFAQLAKQVSQDPGSAKQGGELGWFQKGIMIKAFEDAAFSLGKNEVSNVVETEFGFHVIKVEDRKDAGYLPVKEAEPAIREALASQKSVSLAREALMKVDAKAGQAKTDEELKKAASSEKGVKGAVTGYFSENDRKEGLARNQDLSLALFSLSPGQGSRIVETDEGAYLLRVVDRKDAHVPDFNEVGPKVKEALAIEKAGSEARGKAQQVLEKLRNGEDMAKVAASEKLKVESTGLFGRIEGFMPRTGIFVGDKEDLFALDEKAPYYPEVLSQSGKHYVFKFSGVKEASEAGFEMKKDDIRSRLLAEKQEEALSKWLNGLREKSKIMVNEGML